MTFKCWGCGWQGSSTLGGTCPNCGGTDHIVENTHRPTEQEFKAHVFGDFQMPKPEAMHGAADGFGGEDFPAEKIYGEKARCKCPPENFLHLDTCPEFFPGGLKRNP